MSIKVPKPKKEAKKKKLVKKFKVRKPHTLKLSHSSNVAMALGVELIRYLNNLHESGKIDLARWPEGLPKKSKKRKKRHTSRSIHPDA